MFFILLKLNKKYLKNIKFWSLRPKNNEKQKYMCQKTNSFEKD